MDVDLPRLFHSTQLSISQEKKDNSNHYQCHEVLPEIPRRLMIDIFFFQNVFAESVVPAIPGPFQSQTSKFVDHKEVVGIAEEAEPLNPSKSRRDR